MAALWLTVRILLGVLAVLLGLVALALFVPVTAELRADEKGFAAWLRVLFVRIKLYPRPPKKEKPRRPKQRKKARAPAKGQERPAPSPAADAASAGTARADGPAAGKEQAAHKAGAGRQTAAQTPAGRPEQKKEAGAGKKDGGAPSLADKLPKDLDRTLALVSTAGGAVRRLLAGLTVHGVKAFLPVHRDTAAETALAVGGVWAAVGAALGALQNFVRIRPGEITVQPDYTGKEQEKASFSCKITSHLFIMVLVGIWAFRRLKEQKIL